MTLTIITLFVTGMLAFRFIGPRLKNLGLRDIPAYYRLRGAIEAAVEEGSRIHITIGRGDIASPQAAAALVGLSMLKQIAEIASDGDRPPIVTAGDGALTILAQDTLRGAHQAMGISPSDDQNLARITGLTPFSYAAGTISLISDEAVSANLLAGSVGIEAGLITAAGERSQTLTIAGTDTLPGQAVLYASAHEPLVGEELYAGGAYLDVGPMHTASLHTQDLIRWLLIMFIIFSALAGLVKGFL